MDETEQPYSLTERENKQIKAATSFYVPREYDPITNDYLALVLQKRGITTNSGNPIDGQFIIKRTRIEQRYLTQKPDEWIAKSDQIIPFMGATVLRDALNQKGWEIDDLDFILATTSFPLSRPISESIYKIVKSKKTLVSKPPVCLLEGYAACSGFVHWFNLIKQDEESFKGKKIAIIASEQYSAHVDGIEIIIFADGAGGMVFSYPDDLEILGAYSQYFGDPNGYIKMRMQEPPQSPYSQQSFFIRTQEPEEGDVYMNGTKVFEFALTKNLLVPRQAIEHAKLTYQDIKTALIHQANGRITESIWESVSKEGFKGEFPSNIGKYGNTSSASVPILLDEVNRQGKIKSQDTILLWAMGAGLFSSAAVVRLN